MTATKNNPWDDPRWQLVWQTIGPGSSDLADSSEQPTIKEAFEALELIAADRRLDAEERDLAREMLDDVADSCREHISETLRALASIDVPGNDPDLRENARMLLLSAITRIREVISDPSTTEDVRQQAIRSLGSIRSS